MAYQRQRHTILAASIFLGGAALSACGQDESEAIHSPAAQEDAAVSTADVGLCTYVCIEERGWSYEFCRSCCQNPACCAAKKLRFCSDLPPLPAATQDEAAASTDVGLCTYVCIEERGWSYEFCRSCCQNPACCAAKKLRFCSDPPPLPAATTPAAKAPGPCAEECRRYYLSCLGEDPSELREHICHQDYIFCLGTWPQCTPPVR